MSVWSSDASRAGLTLCPLVAHRTDYAELDRADQARAVNEELAAAEFAHVPVDAVWLRCLTDCASVCAYLGDAARAAALYRLLAPYGDQLPVFVVGTAGGSVLHYLGLLATIIGWFDDAEARLAAAASLVIWSGPGSCSARPSPGPASSAWETSNARPSLSGNDERA